MGRGRLFFGAGGQTIGRPKKEKKKKRGEKKIRRREEEKKKRKKKRRKRERKEKNKGKYDSSAVPCFNYHVSIFLNIWNSLNSEFYSEIKSREFKSVLNF